MNVTEFKNNRQITRKMKNIDYKITVQEIETLKMIKNYADKYSENAQTTLVKNNHINADIDQKIIDAVLVDFINFMGFKHGIDYALSTSDLRK